MEKSIATVC